MIELTIEEKAEILLKRFQQKTNILMAKIDKAEDMYKVADIYQELTDMTREIAKNYDELLESREPSEAH